MAFRYTGFADEAGKPLDVQIATVKEAGWSSIELRQIGSGHVCDLSDDEWARVWDRLQAEGISVAGFGGQVANWARPISGDFQRDMDELVRVAPRMKQAGTSLLRIMSYPNDSENPWSEEDWKAEVFKRLRNLAAVAEDNGVILGHENCNGYGSLGPDQYLEMKEAVDSPALKVIFDTGNNSLHDNDLGATWRYYEACKPDIVHVHIKSAHAGPEGKVVTCFPDEDPTQKRVLQDLKDGGYCGWMSIEPHLAAAIHEGKSADDSDAPKLVWLEYARRLEALVADLT